SKSLRERNRARSALRSAGTVSLSSLTSDPAEQPSKLDFMPVCRPTAASAFHLLASIHCVFRVRVFPLEGIPMRKVFTVCSLAVLAFVVAAIAVRAQQDKSKRPSPPATAKCELASGKSVTIDYSSPRKKGRAIFGDLVPYGQVWRAGANEATTFVTSADVTVGGTHVPAGSYTIFTIPEKDKWTLVVSKTTGEWGTAYSGEKADLARIPMKVGSGAAMENFTISFDKGA